MQDDYYQNILYPLQDRILKLISPLPVDFYLTGGTVLSRVYLHHRYSDDLDFFANNINDFKNQVDRVIKAFRAMSVSFEVALADESYARIFIHEGKFSIKIDLINDVSFRSGQAGATSLFIRTDNIYNILSNKLTALSRYAAKDVVDIVYISENQSFDWENVFQDANEKDVWVNPINAAEILEKFPVEQLHDIAWIGEPPSSLWFTDRLKGIIRGIIEGSDNIPDFDFNVPSG